VNEIAKRAEKNPFFWITMGALFYFIGSLFLEGFLTFLMNTSLNLAQLYNKLGFLFKYLTCILFIIGILSSKK
jgi:hypothetical protein